MYVFILRFLFSTVTLALIRLEMHATESDIEKAYVVMSHAVSKHHVFIVLVLVKRSMEIHSLHSLNCIPIVVT